MFRKGDESGNQISDLLMLRVWADCQAAQGGMEKISTVPSKKFLSLGGKKEAVKNCVLPLLASRGLE